MKKLDYLLIFIYVVFSIAIAIILIIPESDYSSKYVEISINNKEYMKVDLPIDQKKIISIENDYGKNVIVIEHDSVEMYESDCFDNICVLEGKKNKVGDVIACLPHKLIIEIKGINENNDIDGISY